MQLVETYRALSYATLFWVTPMSLIIRPILLVQQRPSLSVSVYGPSCARKEELLSKEGFLHVDIVVKADVFNLANLNSSTIRSMLDRNSITTSLQACNTPLSLLKLMSQFIGKDGTISPFSTFTPAIYDTAWLSMVHRTSSNGNLDWLFPMCWDYILDTQLDDGAWPSYSAPIDGILNTLASLLALFTRGKYLEAHSELASSLNARIASATRALQQLLSEWNVEDTVHVGFEVLVPRLLHQLSAFDVHFDFPGEKQLQSLYTRRIKKFRPEMVYASVSTTLIHSLEALIGLVDFDKVRHHCTGRNGMLGSPAATAAYIMNATDWDEKAESYLRRVVAHYGAAVPSAFPTEIFEISWVSQSDRVT